MGRFWPDRAWVPLVQPQDPAWKDDVRAVLESYLARTPGSRIEEKDTAMVWHFREAEPDLARWQARELASLLDALLANRPVEVVGGASIVEVRQMGVDKGSAYLTVEQRFGPFDFTLVTGDDRTDEDVFALVGPEVDSICVGAGLSRAKVALASPENMREFLWELVEARRRS